MLKLNPKRRNKSCQNAEKYLAKTPKIWDAARYEIDTRGQEGQFILTGSAVPIESKEITHSGTGRFSWLTMRPMTLFESGESNGTVSLEDLFNKPKEIYGTNDSDIERLAFYICRGGWPHSIGMKEKAALSQVEDYYDAVVKSDINRADGVNKNPERVKRLMRSFARNQGGQVANTLFRDDIAANDVDTLMVVICVISFILGIISGMLGAAALGSSMLFFL